MWRTVVITQHSKISVALDNLVIQTREETHTIPLSDIGTILIETTQAVVTGYALAICIQRGIAVICCTDKHLPAGQFIAYYPNSNRRANIAKQMQWTQRRKDKLWTAIVKSKILHQAKVLEKNHKSDHEKIQDLAVAVLQGDSGNCEANAARMYFPRLFSYEFQRSDADNNINALLDYGYTVLLSEAVRHIVVSGYLTEFGIHHNNDSNPYNFASDLMEPFRPFVDDLVVSLEHHELTPDTKHALVGLLREDLPAYGTTISKMMGSYVRESLQYMNKDREEPPSLSW